MNRVFKVGLLLMLPLILAQVAAADSFTFTFTGVAGSNANGYVDATAIGAGQYLAVSGWLNITSGVGLGHYSLIPVGPDPFSSVLGTSGWWYSVDDVIYDPGNPFVDLYGLLFTDGIRQANLYGTGTDVYALSVWDPAATAPGFTVGDTSGEAGKATLTHNVPEPSSLILTGLGILAIGMIRRKRRVTA